MLLHNARIDALVLKAITAPFLSGQETGLRFHRRPTIDDAYRVITSIPE